MIAVAKAMQALAPPGFKCYLFEPKLSKPPVLSDYPYVFLWGRPGNRLSGEEFDDSLSDTYRGELVEVKATYVGLNDDSLNIVMNRFRAAWDRINLEVPGFARGRLKQSELMDAQADETAVLVGNYRPRYAVDQYRFMADRI